MIVSHSAAKATTKNIFLAEPAENAEKLIMKK
jgi:hypothetical protein